MDEVFETCLKNAEDVVHVAKNPEIVAKVEHTVILWCKNIEKVLAISKQMRKETDTMGPLAELAYWRNLMAKMCYIIQQVQQWNVINFIQVLVHAKSRVLRVRQTFQTRISKFSEQNLYVESFVIISDGRTWIHVSQTSTMKLRITFDICMLLRSSVLPCTRQILQVCADFQELSNFPQENISQHF